MKGCSEKQEKMAFILLPSLPTHSKYPTNLSGHSLIENNNFLYTGSYLIYFSTLTLCCGSLVTSVNTGLHPFKIVLHYTDEPFLNLCWWTFRSLPIQSYQQWDVASQPCAFEIGILLWWSAFITQPRQCGADKGWHPPLLSTARTLIVF